MQAVIATKYGPPDVLTVQTIPKPTRKPNEILIRIHATPVNAGDCEMRSFKLPWLFWLPVRLMMGIRKPRIGILGQELAGVVEEVGEKVERFQKGDEVFGNSAMKFATYAEYICLPESSALVKKSQNLLFEEASTISVGGSNALYFIRKAEIREGEHVLVIGAGGGIGLFAVQLAKLQGATVTGVDTTAKLPTITAFGADHVIDFTKEDFTAQDTKYDVIYDIADKNDLRKLVKCLSPTGRYVCTNYKVSFSIKNITSEKKLITGLADYIIEDLEYLQKLFDEKKLRTHIDKKYSMKDIVEAHKYVESGNKIGMVILSLVE